MIRSTRLPAEAAVQRGLIGDRQIAGARGSTTATVPAPSALRRLREETRAARHVARGRRRASAAALSAATRVASTLPPLRAARRDRRSARRSSQAEHHFGEAGAQVAMVVDCAKPGRERQVGQLGERLIH